MRLALRRQLTSLWLTALFVAATLLFQLAPALAAGLKITDVKIDPGADTIRLQGNTLFEKSRAKEFTVLKLANPYRVVVDIPEAKLGMSNKVLRVNKNGIDRIEFSQQKSKFYDSLRVTIFVNDSETLWKINTNNVQDALLLSQVNLPMLGDIIPSEPKKPSRTAAATPIPPVVAPNGAYGTTPTSVASPLPDGKPDTRSVLEELAYRNDALYMRAANQKPLTVKNRFTLNNPSRLVLDVAHATASSKDLFRPIAVNSGDIKQVRVGQFDDDTLRVVIETDRPEAIEVVYATPQKDSVLISPYLGTSVATLPAETKLAKLESVQITKDASGQSMMRIESSAAIVYKAMRTNNGAEISLLNVAANPGWVAFNHDEHPDLGYVKLTPLTAGQPNSKLVIELDDNNNDIAITPSLDGRTLSIVLQPGVVFTANNASVSKAPFKARIVVDAGHGGKDHGAIRAGIREKDMNLNLALMLRTELEKRGFKVYMTRSDDTFVPLPGITGYTNNVMPDIFVSVHHNASTNPGLAGLETYYYTPQSLGLAQKVHKRLVNNVRATDRGVRRNMFYVVHHTRVPAILCEVGYVSNTSEREALLTRDRNQRTVYAIAEGVVDYLKSKATAMAKPAP